MFINTYGILLLMQKIFVLLGLFAMISTSVFFVNTKAQPIDNNNKQVEANLSSFISKINSTPSMTQLPVFSFFFKAYGGIAILDNNVFYDSKSQKLEHIISVNGDFENPIVIVEEIPENEMLGLKHMILNSDFFEANSDYSNGAKSNAGKILTITMDNRSHTIYWIETDSLPINLRELAKLFDETCNKIC